MAHEMGHNFGSPVNTKNNKLQIQMQMQWKIFIKFCQHDPETDKSCVPGGEDGNYIMFARATRWSPAPLSPSSWLPSSSSVSSSPPKWGRTEQQAFLLFPLSFVWSLSLLSSAGTSWTTSGSPRVLFPQSTEFSKSRPEAPRVASTNLNK